MKQSFFVLISIVIFSCTKDSSTFVIDDAYRAQFPLQKIVKERAGYLQLIGLFELNPATQNSFGSYPENNFVLAIDSLPARIGSISILGDSIVFDADDNVYVLNEKDSMIDRKTILPDELLHHKRWSWMVIERVGKYFLRVWDKDNPAVRSFAGYERYPLSSKFIFEGQFRYYSEPKKAKAQSLLGEEEIEFIGNVEFEFEGESYALDVDKDGFIMIGDKTSAIETYGSGRYLYIDLPSKDSLTVVDFNLCYNPPCTFSEFTTCLFPPTQNVLPFEILAGEKYTGSH